MNDFSVVPWSRIVVEKLKEIKINQVAKKIKNRIEKTITYIKLSLKHWIRIRTDNTIGLFNFKIKRCTRVIGSLLVENSTLMLVRVRLCHATGIQWRNDRKRESHKQVKN